MRIGLFGCGAYGMAISDILSYNKHEITMWTKFEEEKKLLEETRANEKLIPNFKISKKIKITTSIEETIKEKDLLIIAIPAAFVESLAKEMKPFIKGNKIIIATKGIQQQTGLFINEILEKYLDTKHIAAISGGTFAKDLVKRKSAGLTIASQSPATIKLSKEIFENDYIKISTTKDIHGVELCGSLKNIIALGSGMLEGMNSNETTISMFLTESVINMMKILKKFNAEEKTVISYAGIGDLILTCTSTSSRNYSFGKLIGERKTKEELDEYLLTTTVEGYYTLKSVHQLFIDKKINNPLIETIYQIAVENKSPKNLLTFLVEK